MIKALIIGAVIGAVTGYLMGSQGIGANQNITGGFARPFQYKIDPGKGLQGG